MFQFNLNQIEMPQKEIKMTRFTKTKLEEMKNRDLHAINLMMGPFRYPLIKSNYVAQILYLQRYSFGVTARKGSLPKDVKKYIREENLNA